MITRQILILPISDERLEKREDIFMMIKCSYIWHTCGTIYNNEICNEIIRRHFCICEKAAIIQFKR